MERIDFLDCPVDNLCMLEALDWMETRIRDRNPGMIAVINANKLWLMSHTPRLNKIVKKAELVIAEWGVFWGAQRLGLPLKDFICGILLAKESIPWAQKKGYKLYFLGARLEVVEHLVHKVVQEFPGIQIAGYHDGYLDQAETQKVVNEIKHSRPDILLVAMGSPRQEYWIRDHFAELQVPVSMGVGGSFDVLAGLKKDTPRWARGHGWEWLYRLSQDPKAYWKRYLVTNSWIIWNVFKQYISNKFIKKIEKVPAKV